MQKYVKMKREKLSKQKIVKKNIFYTKKIPFKKLNLNKSFNFKYEY